MNGGASFAALASGDTSPLEIIIMADKSRVPDPTYNLISVLYHTLQAGDLYTQYIADAKEAGDTELANFLEATQSAATETAAKARGLLAARMKS